MTLICNQFYDSVMPLAWVGSLNHCSCHTFLATKKKRFCRRLHFEYQTGAYSVWDLSCCQPLVSEMWFFNKPSIIVNCLICCSISKKQGLTMGVDLLPRSSLKVTSSHFYENPHTKTKTQKVLSYSKIPPHLSPLQVLTGHQRNRENTIT